ncbi:SusC/RagA family TonB-linked outer membrane protein [Flavobacteriaceae bacterium]|nr:SusC/RagA family TonB-linked outer membrane protein [Flavobacteriaceae bacterium]MDC1279323.1 SusC/RagA family TonB-linked outer membrane protein [bacterium]
MKIKSHLTLLFALMGLAFGFAQTQLSGSVTDANGESIPGATIIVQETNNGTTSDFDGNFSITVDQDQNLEISYLGYTTQIIQFTGQDNISVSLTADQNELDEIVVTGYGSQKRSQLTGAVAKIGGGEIAALQVARVDDALAGKLSGVLIQNQDGSPGAAPKIQIRAASSISGASNPLIVVDGYPISGGIESVNQNDIQSLSILKDAASAAIYGSRGANGVILITTKKGKTGKATFSYNAYVSSSSKYRDNILKSGPEWAAFARAEIAAGNWSQTVASVDPAFLEYRLTAYEDSPGAISPEDWLFQTGNSTNHDFSVSGGSDDVKYFASVGYQDIEGVVITQGYERLNFRMNVDANLGDKFKTGISANGFTSKRDILGHDMRDLLRSYGVHPIYHTAASIAFVQQLDAKAQALGLTAFDNGYRGSGYQANSIYSLEPGMAAQDWHYGRANNGIGGSGDAGPAAKLDNVERWEKTFFANVSGYLQYNILDELKLKTVLGGDIRDTQAYSHRLLGYDSRARSSQTFMNQTDLKISTLLSETTLNYTKVIGNHDISAIGGFEVQTTKLLGTGLSGVNVPDDAILNFNLFAPADITVSERDETRVRESVFGRLNYAYDNRFLASVSIRRDGDSRFGANKRYETFPALSLGWNMHNEAFLQDSELLSQLKVRFSTGSLGTTSFLGSFDSLSLLSPATTIYGTGFLIPSNSSNPDLTWQTNTETNFGVDLGFLNNRFTLGVDYYTSDIENILINQAQSEVLGNPTSILNVGDVKSSGLEFELSARLIDNGTFGWNMNANLSTVDTEITYLGGLEELPQQIFGQSGRGAVFRNYVGGGIGEMWGLETTEAIGYEYLTDGSRHPNSMPDASYVVDQNGDGVIDRTRSVADGGDLVKIGQNTPDFYWGMSHNLRYKEFDMSLQFQGSHGADVYNIDPLYYGSQWGGRVSGIPTPTDGTIVERNRNQTDYPLQDASYVSLRNLTIGYTLESDLIENVGLSSVRAYLAGSNLLYIFGDDYTSYNPEGVKGTDPTTYGAQVGASPVVRSITLGLNVNF